MARLLLADHNPTNRKIVELSFAPEGIEVHAHADGASALQALRDEEFDVVLADVSLPSVDGYRLCREIKSQPRSADTPVVLLVGRFEPFDQKRAEEAGYHSRLTKPVEPPGLVTLVRRLLESPRTRAAPLRRRKGFFSVQPERRTQMLFEIPVADTGSQVVFPLKVYQCKVDGETLLRQVVAPIALPVDGSQATKEEQPPPEPEADHADFSGDAVEAVEAAAESPADSPPVAKEPEDDVDRIMERLSSRLPELIREVLDEERKD